MAQIRKRIGERTGSISAGFRQFETDIDGVALPIRVFRANDDLSLQYPIQS